MTQKQHNKLDVINKANAGFLTVPEAASALGLSERQVQRLKKEVRELGPAALVHKNSFKVPHNFLSIETIDTIVSLKKTDLFEACNFNHFRELLSEHYNIDISYSTLYGILSNAGIKSPMTRRRYKPHRRRKRRPQAGLLLQVDATPYAWFKGNSKKYSLHGAIDDATGQITGLYLCKNECLLGYFEMLERTIKNFGIPMSIYADRHTIFQSPNKEKAIIDSSVKVNDTQFGRCLKELSVELIPARSPQAKGRIERLWATLQSRLPVEFAIRDITSIDQANEFLANYIYAYNSEFAVEPADSDSMFIRPDTTSINFDYILCIKDTRNVDSGGVFSFKNKTFKVLENSYSAMIPPNAKCQVLTSSKFGVKLQYRGIVFEVSRYIPAKRKPTPKKEHIPQSVPDNHYFKYGQSLTPKLIYDEPDHEITCMLEDLFLKKQA